MSQNQPPKMSHKGVRIVTIAVYHNSSNNSTIAHSLPVETWHGISVIHWAVSVSTVRKKL